MIDNNSTKKRLNFDEKYQKKINYSLNFTQNSIDNLKRDINSNKTKLIINSDQYEPFTKINIKNIQSNIISDYEYENKSKKKQNLKQKLVPSKNYYHKRNYYSKDFSNYKIPNNNNTN